MQRSSGVFGGVLGGVFRKEISGRILRRGIPAQSYGVGERCRETLSPRPATGSEAVLLPVETVRAVRDLVGSEGTAA
ncbi:hypothetical protein ABT168_29095, partial [Streptomyces sp. NPDC001793]|uniref:hypothetical protein n=1 Tax=Streptomyces sp. NPDC001793 TaxID=3154657 RepID=UPI003330EDCE